MKKTTITLNIVQLPMLVLMLAVAASSAGVALKTKLESNASATNTSLTLAEQDYAAVLSQNDSRGNSEKIKVRGDENSIMPVTEEFVVEEITPQERNNIRKTQQKSDEQVEFEVETEGYDDDAAQIDAKAKVAPESTPSKGTFLDFSPELKIKVHEANDNSQGASSETRVKIMVKQGLENAGLAEAVEELELTLEQTGQSSASLGSYTYKGVAQKSEALLGLFHISIPVDVVIDPETGEVIDQNQSLVSKILDLFSF